MQSEDSELEQLRRKVNCAALLEGWSPEWRLDGKQSTRSALKYRRSEGEILIVNHDGRGWWDPQSTAKGDMFDLVQYLDPTLTFRQVCQVLRRFVGVIPTFPDILRGEPPAKPGLPVAARWMKRPRLCRGSPAWTYLTNARRLPAEILAAADAAHVLREGPHGSAWFAHRNGNGAVTHVEIRGPDFKGSLRGGAKTLFQFRATGTSTTRIAVTEAPIDALSLAAIEGMEAATLYVATGGGMGPGTVAALEQALRAIGAVPEALLVSATDANAAGERYAARHAVLAAAAGVRFMRLEPTCGTDWDDVLQTTGCA